MPIRFHCSNCQQRLSVASGKANQDVKCPRCRRVVRVPSGEPKATASQPPEVEHAAPSPIPPFPLVEPGDELVYAADEESREATARPGEHGVFVPRRVVYLQGFLLGAVALAFFIFGFVVGGRSSKGPGQAESRQPCTITGTVVYENAARATLPDAGSVVALVPTGIRPDQKVMVDGLRPDDPVADEDHPGLALIRSLGGDYDRVDRRGRFRLRAPTSGRYYLLVLSRHAMRPDGEQPAAKDLAQIGRYFLPATQLIGGSRYTWKEIRLREDRQLNEAF